MVEVLTMPKLSPTMEEGTIVKWRVQVGSRFQVGDVLLEVATDKATVEHSALDGGFLRKILIQEGGNAVVNQPIALFTETLEESIEGFQPKWSGGKEKKPAKEESAAPTAEKEEEKPAAAPKTGEMRQPAFVPEPPLAHYVFESDIRPIKGEITASPLAKKLAEEKHLDLSTVKGTGPSGRITSHDLSRALPKASVSFGRREIPEIAPGSYEEEPLTPMRRVIGRRLQESKTFIPHFYVSQEVDADALVVLREQFKEGGLKLTVNDFIIRATALALKDHPLINSGFDSVNQAIIRFQTIDIALAVDVAGGLITPIIRHADYKNIGELSSEAKHLAALAKAGKLERSQYIGGSFTISNLGMFGIQDFIAVINPPQAAILAVGGIQEKAVVKQGQIQVGRRMMLTLSVDHRVVDGSEGARFLNTLKKYLESPALLIVG